MASVSLAQSTRPTTAPGQKQATGRQSVRAVIASDHGYVNCGDPVWIDFLLQNLADEPVVLSVPNTDAASPDKNTPMGLPMDHVFSGDRFRALDIVDGQGKEVGRDVMIRPLDKTVPVTLAPKSIVGIRVEMGQYYTALRRTGIYMIEWRPYGGEIKSNSLRLEVRALKEVVMVTNYGTIRLGLLYDKAPNTVANFVELVENGFYNRLKFFRLYPGVAVLGGCPNNDGSGLRRDGRTIKAELNDTPFEEGTVAMSLSGDDLDSASCQFFICLRRVKQWDAKYTAFAKAIGPESLETLRKIGRVEGDANDRPVTDVIIERMNLDTVRRKGSEEASVSRSP